MFAERPPIRTIEIRRYPNGVNMRIITLSLMTAALLCAADDRAADRAAIRAHIDRIFQAFIHKDIAELRATHDANWLGYLEGPPTVIRGLDGYMATTDGLANPDHGMHGYKMR